METIFSHPGGGSNFMFLFEASCIYRARIFEGTRWFVLRLLLQ